MRHRIVRYAFLVVLAVAPACPRPRASPIEGPIAGGHLWQESGMRVLYLQGTPYQMGLQQGVMLRDALRQLLSDYLHQRIIVHHGLSHSGLRAWARLLDPDVPPALRRELQGIADGAGLSYQDVLLLNVVPDLLALTRRPYSWESSSLLHATARHSLPSCVEFAAWGRSTEDKDLIVGHNLHSPDSDLLSPHVLVTVRQPDRGNALASVGLAGTVGVWAGISEEKITVALSSSPSVDSAWQGQPLPFLLRQALGRARDLGEAMDVILSAPRLSGGNVILADAKTPKAVAIEASAHRYAIFESTAECDALARTNHFLDPELALSQQGVLPDPERPANRVRLLELRSLVCSSSQMDVETGLAILRDDRVTGYPGNASYSDDRSTGVLQSVLFHPSALAMWVARSSAAASSGLHVRIELGASLLGHGQAALSGSE